MVSHGAHLLCAHTHSPPVCARACTHAHSRTHITSTFAAHIHTLHYSPSNLCRKPQVVANTPRSVTHTYTTVHHDRWRDDSREPRGYKACQDTSVCFVRLARVNRNAIVGDDRPLKREYSTSIGIPILRLWGESSLLCCVFLNVRHVACICQVDTRLASSTRHIGGRHAK